MRRLLFAGVVACAGGFLIVACGGTPVMPTPGGGGADPQPPANNLPVIDSISVQGARSPKEPASFADLGESVAVAAKVHDDETPADQLDYQWSAPVGTFTGTGASVVWQAPATAATTPADVTITLKVVEHYGNPGGPVFSHDVSGTATVSLHDSVGEVGGMARQFLLDFSDSSMTDVPHIMRNFDPSCKEAQDEAQQVADNRRQLKIVRSIIGLPTVTVPFGDAFCPIFTSDPSRSQRGDACSSTPSHWESKVLANGHSTIADGLDWISAYYHPELRAWKLCDSQFPGTCIDETTGATCGSQALAIAPGFSRR
jgi:hypothetical protein